METEITYLMKPAEDVIIFGVDLAEGMWVLPEHPDQRLVHGSDFEEGHLRRQRFCRVTRLRKIQGTRYGDSGGTVFVGEWVDGYQEVISANMISAWIVKKDSLPTDPESLAWQVLAVRIFELREQRDADNDYGQAEEDELDELEAIARRKLRSADS